MAEQYLDFDLLIDRSGEGYRARVLDSPAGRGTAVFTLPFSTLELENYLLRIGRPRRGMRRVESPESEAVKTFGGRLFEAVFDGEVGRCLRNSLDEATRQGKGLRLRLRFEDAPDLINLPWEYLYNPAVNRFLSLSTATPVVRFLELPEVVQPLPLRTPLKVLAMISSPADYPALDVEREWANLKEALSALEAAGQVRVERLERPTLAALLPRIRKEEFHIFHFVGHGGFDPQAQDGLLILESEDGRSQTVSGQVLGTLLHDERTLRLAVLNACEGARTSGSDPFSGVAQSLVQQRIPAVIAMQFEVSDEAAILFSRSFYTSLVDGLAVDAALAEARRAIYAGGNYSEWGTPVLYTGAPDGQIFNIEPGPEAGPGSQPVPQTGAAAPSLPAAPPAPSPLAGLPRWALPAAGALLLLVLALVFLLGRPGRNRGVSVTTPEASTATVSVLAVNPTQIVGAGLSTETAAVEETTAPPASTASPSPTGTATSTASPSETPTLETTNPGPGVLNTLVFPRLTLDVGILVPGPSLTPSPTPTFAPGLDIAANCLSTGIWSIFPPKNTPRGGCWDLVDRGFSVADGLLQIQYPPTGSSASSYSDVHGIYYPIPSEGTVQLSLQIDEFTASGKGVFFIGVTPSIPVFDTQVNLLHFQTEGLGQPVVLKYQNRYVLQPNGNYYRLEKGRRHEIVFELNGRQLSVWIDGSQAGTRAPLLRAPQHYLWIGYLMEGRASTLSLLAQIGDLR